MELKRFENFKVNESNKLDSINWTDEEKDLITSVINYFGFQQHPACDNETLSYFQIDYLNDLLQSEKFKESKNKLTEKGKEVLSSVEDKIEMKLNEYFHFEEDDEIGDILLKYGDDSPTTWFYVEDAIINGLLDEKLQLNEEIIENFCHEQLSEEMCGQYELCDFLIDDFDNVLTRLLDYLKEREIIEEIPNKVTIIGEDETGKKFNLIYKK